MTDQPMTFGFTGRSTPMIEPKRRSRSARPSHTASRIRGERWLGRRSGTLGNELAHDSDRRLRVSATPNVVASRPAEAAHSTAAPETEGDASSFGMSRVCTGKLRLHPGCMRHGG